MIRFPGYGVIAEKPAKFFRAPCRKHYALDQKMDGTFFDGHDELYHHAEFGKDRAMRAGCRCENVVFVFCLFFVCLSRFVLPFTICTLVTCHGKISKSFEILIQFWKEKINKKKDKYLAFTSVLRNVRNSVVTVVLQNKAV